ncbi:GntR family transcriptional regulator, partial [Staphylococcus epidermidis]
MKRNKFLMIYEDLKNNILSQDLNYGDQLPSEHDLVATYNASRETVRKALNLLERDGMIQKMRGKGSIVIFQEITEFPFTDLISFK